MPTNSIFVNPAFLESSITPENVPICTEAGTVSEIDGCRSKA